MKLTEYAKTIKEIMEEVVKMKMKEPEIWIEDGKGNYKQIIKTELRTNENECIVIHYIK